MDIANYHNIVKTVLKDFEYPDFQWVYKRPSIAELYKPDKRCGIYVLRFQNNQYYVGQAVDVIRRYVQHSKVHEDIQEITFKNFTKEELNKIEAEIIKVLESKKVKLRNINLTSIPKGETDLDLVISSEEQELWLKSNTINQLNEHIINLPDHEDKYAKKFQTLLKKKGFETIAKLFLIEYFRKCVIQPQTTELTFWGITLLNKAFTDIPNIALCRLNFYWCEVLTIWVDDDDEIVFTFHLTKSVLTKTHLKSFRIKSLDIIDHYYPRGGPDQFRLDVTGLDDALKLLSDNKVIESIKTFNLRQMQKGATVYGKYHCIDLAREILRTEVNT